VHKSSPSNTACTQTGVAEQELLVEIDEEGRVGVITLNRPARRNALTLSFLDRIASTCRDLDARQDISSIILTGTDPAFCAGFDLKDLSTEDRQLQIERQDRAMEYPGLLPPLRLPVIGAINGPAVTGGLELALSCDFLICSTAARFADTHARVGAMPGGGLTIRLPERIGMARALQMSLTGDFISPDTALAWGLVNEVVPHDELLPRARALAAAVASIPPENIAEIKKMYAVIQPLSDVSAFEAELEWARHWMAKRFDQHRLSTERSSIVERGRTQAK
jgi:enoyl-CoA hydratase